MPGKNWIGTDKQSLIGEARKLSRRLAQLVRLLGSADEGRLGHQLPGPGPGDREDPARRLASMLFARGFSALQMATLRATG